MTAIVQERLNVDDVVYFSDIEDVLKKSFVREKSSGGTIIFTSINGCHFIPGKYNVFYINKHTVIMCLEGVDALKIHKYLMNTNCMNFSDPHLINRYDWKRTCCDGDSTPAEIKSNLAENGIEVEEEVLGKLKYTIGDSFCHWTYIVKGNSNVNSISEDKLTVKKVELNSENAPKGFYLLKHSEDDSVIGFVCKVVTIGGYEYGALLMDPTLGHFAFIYSDEHICNSADKTPEELPNQFTGVVNLKDFTKS